MPADSTEPGAPSGPASIAPEKWAYFEGEARAARAADNPGHLNPVFPPGARVISVGCGGGWEGEGHGTSRFVGVDVDEDARAYRTARGITSEFHLGSGEALPFPDGDFTFYMARVSVMYMDLGKCFSEADRVLAKDGQLWATCHDFDHVWAHWKTCARTLALKALLFRTYVILNGLLYHFTGKVVRFPLNRRRIESFQTKGGLRRGLQRAGFRDVEFPAAPRGQLLVTARKPG